MCVDPVVINKTLRVCTTETHRKYLIYTELSLPLPLHNFPHVYVCICSVLLFYLSRTGVTGIWHCAELFYRYARDLN